MIEKEKVARPEGIEPPTLCLEGRRSIHLSYGRAASVDSTSFFADSERCFRRLDFCGNVATRLVKDSALSEG
jgi:hypothetical protein